MTCQALTEDCIIGILANLQDDRSTLYKCLFVNRLFCRTIIPTLYKKPFDKTKDHLHYYLLINTFLSCLNEEERLYLTQNEIYIKNETKTLFEYGRYIERFFYTDLIISLDYWYSYKYYNVNENQKYIPKNEFDQYRLELLNDKGRLCMIKNTLLHLFFRQSINLKYLFITYNIFESRLFNSRFLNEIIMNLKDLEYLSIFINENNECLKNSALNEFLVILSEYCANFVELNIFITGEYELAILPPPISNIIKRQKNLRKFTFWKHNRIQLSNIFESLESQQNSLTLLQLDCCKELNNESSIDNLVKFINLESLDLFSCDGVNLDICKKLSNSNFKLKNLELLENFWEPDVTAAFISVVGHSLNNLIFKELNRNISLDEVYKAIISSCKKLDKFETWIRCDLDLNIFNYLKNIKCNHLFIYLDFNIESKKAMSKFGKNLPDDLKIFSIKNYAGTTPAYLENFFINYDDGNSLQVLNFNFLMIDDYLEIILKYIGKMKSLKVLGIIENYDDYLVENNQKNHLNKDLLDEIRNYDIKIIEIKED